MKNRRIGQKFFTKESLGGYEIIIIEYYNSKNVIIEFQDIHKARLCVEYSSCKKGIIKNPYHPSICNVGCLGLRKDGSKPLVRFNGNITREYQVWCSMINRCYNQKTLHKRPTYENVSVCDRWLCFSNFLEDLPHIEGYDYWLNNPNKKIMLDKDKKQRNIENKIYSIETCQFISIEDNSKEVSYNGNPMLGKTGSDHPLSQKVLCLNTGETFNSVREALEWCGGGNISACCKGKQATAGKHPETGEKLKWVYL